VKIVKINTNYFGELEVDENEILEFEKGMLGFEELKKFVIIKDSEIFIEWLQSIEDTTSFAIMDPFIADNNYSFELSETIMKQLDIKSKEDVMIRTVVIIPEDITKIRTNLQAPIIINSKLKKAMQIILDDSYPIRYEFYDKAGV
jgi:flagellar assembly factor FliW